MSGLYSLLQLGHDTLQAQAYALDVTGQNVANVNTPGYVRREAQLETRASGTTTYGGVEATGIHRFSDEFAQQRLRDATSDVNAASTANDALATMEAIFNDMGGAGLSSSITGLFDSFSALSANPSDPVTRTQVLQAADTFASRIRDASSQLSARRQELLTQAQSITEEINARGEQIAKINAEVAKAEGAGGDAADLKDQRDRLIQELSERIDTKATLDNSGKFIVRVGGATLVEGTQAGALSVTATPAGAMQINVQRALVDLGGTLNGGKLAGIRQARDTDSAALLQQLDRLSFDVATALNAQHAGGFGLDGVTGRALFQVAAPPGSSATIALDANMVGHPERVAAATTLATIPGGSNNAVALSALGSTRIASGNSRTALEAYSDIVGDVGLRKQSAEQMTKIRDSIQSQAKTIRDSASGVSMDEEMVNLTKYQRAYEAGSKLLRTADELLNNLIQQI